MEVMILSVIKKHFYAVEMKLLSKMSTIKKYTILIDKQTETAYLESASLIGLNVLKRKIKNH